MGPDGEPGIPGYRVNISNFKYMHICICSRQESILVYIPNVQIKIHFSLLKLYYKKHANEKHHSLRLDPRSTHLNKLLYSWNGYCGDSHWILHLHYIYMCLCTYPPPKNKNESSNKFKKIK